MIETRRKSYHNYQSIAKVVRSKCNKVVYKFKSLTNSTVKSTSSKQQQNITVKSSIQLNKDILINKDKVMRVIKKEIEEIIIEVIEEAIEKSKKLESETRRENIDRRSRITCRRRCASSKLLALTTILSNSRCRSDASDCTTRVVKDQQSKNTKKRSTHNFTQRKLFEIHSKALFSLSY